MRILMLGWFAKRENSGGMEVHIRELCKNISDAEILLIVPKNSNPCISANNVKILEIPCKTNASTVDKVIKNVSEFNKNILKALKKSEYSFDIIHSHDWLCVAAAKELHRKTGKPWVHAVHSLEHIRAGEGTSSEIPQIEKDGINSCSRIITVSNLMKNEITKKYKVPKEKVTVVRNYLSIPRHDIYERKNQKEKIILFLGRLSLQKGVETLISAIPEILGAFSDAKLIIAGEGNLKKSLEKLAEINGVEKSVQFTGFVDGKKLSGLYGRASVFVSPSYFEPFGITILDAAEHNVPIIATENTGALEVFGKNSRITVPAQNRKELAEKIIALLSDEKKQKELALNAKKDLQRADDWEKIAGRTRDIYSELLD
ncbi:D-inositol-3-phosphate glycosyltransferase [uncultured archaeon]|nr:D-inositol-3-phosphate glycosyltransferase [uncultured archaeon]